MLYLFDWLLFINIKNLFCHLKSFGYIVSARLFLSFFLKLTSHFEQSV